MPPKSSKKYNEGDKLETGPWVATLDYIIHDHFGDTKGGKIIHASSNHKFFWAKYTGRQAWFSDPNSISWEAKDLVYRLIQES